MAKFFLKSKNKIFRVRRKKIHWFDVQTETKIIQITVNKLLLLNIKSKKTYKKKILLHMVNILDSYLIRLNDFFKNKNITETPFLNHNKYILINIYLNFLKKNVIRSIATPEYIDLVNAKSIHGIVFSVPKKQIYAVIINKSPKLIFSAGLMRLAMNLESKCSKKSKIVIVNALKFIWMMVNKLLTDSHFFIKFVRNIVYLQAIFLQLEKFEIKKKISYIFFEPKVQFDILNRAKRASLKKNLRKRKKYAAE